MHCIKLFMLVNLCVFLISGFALISLPSPLENVIINVFKINMYRFGILASLSSWSSLLDVVHGYLLDRYLSLNLATWIYSIILFVGSILYSIAGFTKLYWMLILGRTIFGLGLNPLILLCNKHIIIWFGKEKYVNFVYCLTESIIWLGSSSVFFITLHIMHSFEHIYTQDKAFAITNALEMSVFTLLNAAPMIISCFLVKYAETSKEVPPDDQTKANNMTQKKKLTFKDYVCMPLIFWVFSVSVFLYYVSVMSFLSMSLLFFVTKYGVSSSYASSLSGAITLTASVLSPIAGTILDRFGNNLTSFTGAVLLNTLAHALYAFTNCSPIIPVVLMSLSLGFAAGTWSLFQFMVEDHQYMIAYGVAQTGLNGAQAIGTMLAGSILESYGNRGFSIFIFLVILSVVPLLAIMWFLDYRRGFFLNLTPVKKNLYLSMIKENRKEGVDNCGKDNEGFS